MNVRGATWPNRREPKGADAFENVPPPRPPLLEGFAVANSARKTPARTTNRPAKGRRLKKADCEVDFLFIVGVLIFGRRWSPSAEVAKTSQHYFFISLFFNLSPNFPHCSGSEPYF